MKAQHTPQGSTPGPWELDGKIIRHNGVQICKMIDQITTDTLEVDANARLIAAAPALLAACKSALEDARNCQAVSIERLEAAITRAQSPA